jgi:hypothetical protein
MSDTLTDDHHDWVASTLGVDPRGYAGDGGSSDDSGSGSGSGSSGGLWGALSSAASAVSSAVGGAVDSAESAVSSAVDTAESAVSSAASTVSDAAGSVADTVSDAASSVGDAISSTGVVGKAIVDTVKTDIDFSKGVVEGVYEGGKGIVVGVAKGVAAVAKEGYALATDEQAREDALNTVENAAQAVGDFEVEMVTDPSKAFGEVKDAVSNGIDTAGKIAKHVYQSYEEAAAAGHGAEFLGKAVGQGAVLVGGALIPGVGEAEAGVVAAEGAVIVGEAAAAVGEGAAVLGEGAAVLGEGAAVVGEGAAVAGEGAVVAGEGAAALGEGAAAAAAGADALGDAAGAAEVGGEASTAAEAGGQLARDEALLADADPARRVLGAAAESHPEEIAAMTNEMEAAGVETVEREGAMAYQPGLRGGEPGKILMDPQASYSAWLHEYQHFLDDRAAGWGGMRQLFDSAARAQMETNAYTKEIELMTQLGHEDIANELRENLAAELAKIAGE